MANAKVRNDDRLSRELAADGIDVLVVFSMENVFYLSGALFALQDMLRDRLAAAGLARDGRDFLVAATNEMSVARKGAHVAEYRGYQEFRSTAVDELVQLLKDMGLADATIGLEMRYLMAEYYEQLRELLPRARFVGGDRALEVARSIKTPDHIEIIGHTNRLTERAVADAVAATRPGDTEKALAIRMINAMYEQGADTLRHFVVTAGDNAMHAHPYPSAEKNLELGDIIRIDIGGLFGGYGTDIARMAIVGEASEDQARRYRILRDTQREIATRFVPGVRAREVFETAVEGYASRGVPGYKRDHVGHSLSILGGHDNPMLHPSNETVLEENMVFALEPILPDPDGRRYTLEDIFVVTPDGGRLLTTATDTTEMFGVR